MIAIDIGNNFVKAGFFRDGETEEVVSFRHAPEMNPPRQLGELLEKFAGSPAAAISVASPGQTARVLELFQAFQPYEITWQSDFPVKIDYETPETLGMDRLMGAIGAREIAGGRPVLVIDAGTAITYDVIADDVYLGGAISPGLDMRFRALHEFTGRLPQVEPEEEVTYTGKSTLAAIRSGVQYGLIHEAAGRISEYRKSIGENICIFLTGGNALFLKKHLKNINFVNAAPVLHGICAVWKLNQ